MVIIDNNYYEEIFTLMHMSSLQYVKEKKSITDINFSLYEKINNWLNLNIKQGLIYDDVLAMNHEEITFIVNKINTEKIQANDDVKLLKEIYYEFSAKNKGLPITKGLKLTGYDFAKTFCDKEYSCPYCNAVKLDVRELDKVQNPNENNQREPHLDHFYPCSIYPLFSLSIYNLIPACSNCNIMKGDKILGCSPVSKNSRIDRLTTFSLDAKGDEDFGLDVQFDAGMKKNNEELNLKGKYCSGSYDRLATRLYRKLLKYSNESYRSTLMAEGEYSSEIVEKEFETIIDHTKFYKEAFSKWRSDIIKNNLGYK